MTSRGLIEHVTRDHSFKNENLFYRIRDLPPEASSWKEVLPDLGPASGGLQSNIPNGFIDAELVRELPSELSELQVAPLDRHNLALIDHVHPPKWEQEASPSAYNMVVIGAGPGGLVSAAAAAGLGAKVALIESGLMGGDCLNVGCVPSKALLRAAHAIAEIRASSDLGITVEGVSVDFGKIMTRMRKLRADMSHHDSATRFRDELRMDVFIGRGKFISPTEVRVNEQTLKFAKAVVATGAVAAVPKIAGIEEAGYLTNHTVFNLTELPKQLAVIGTGAIGCELAQAFALFGCEVHMFARSSAIMTREDGEAAAVVQEQLARDGVHFHFNVTYEKVEKGEPATLHFVENGTSTSLAFDHILVAVGRQPNVTDMGLEAAGIDFNPRTGVAVNDCLQTSNKNVFACGDVCTKYKFTHVADFMARIITRNAFFFGNAKFSALVLPWCTYTRPAVAHVGLYEHDLEEKGIQFDVFKRPFAEVDRAILDGETEGFVKILTAKGTDKILGATIVANGAGDMISELTLAMNHKIGLSAIANNIHPYPTQGEAIRQLGDAFNRTRLTPAVRLLFRTLMAARR
eukprot:TRINITY_DN5662_c0_g1_i3.p1 TRINITY_DN5662_c0_g1~~TRINITY_DN5662_c0_g1_i3.p1  ORF type:complete len:574 (-),score=139.39 TRINITY_DN5662_c0_g1_i3:97-1818(-)